jgi:hypothetical protein
MHLGDVNYTLSFWLGKKFPGYTLSKGELEKLLHLSQMKHFNKLIGLTEEYKPGQPMPSVFFEENIRITTDIQQFKSEKDLMINNAGYAKLPDDYYYPSALTIKLINGDKIKYRNVRIVSDKEFAEKVGSSARLPNKYFPIGNILGGKIRFAPPDFRYSHFVYLKTPERPVYGLKYDRGFAEYVPSESTELNWDDANLINIMVITLAEIGVSVASADLINITNQEKVTGQ